MEKIREMNIDTKDERDSLYILMLYMNQYPINDGYRIESFFSPKFVRITVYKMGE